MKDFVRTAIRTLVAGATMVATLSLAACWKDEQPEISYIPPPADQSLSEPEYEMQSGYRVGPDGKLLQPEDLPTEPKLPEAARENSDAGSVAFVRYFLEITAYSWNTGTTQALRSISSDECTFCHGIIDSIEKDYAAGNWAAGFGFAVTEVVGVIEYPGRDDCKINVLRFRELEADIYEDSQLKRLPEVKTILELQTCFADGRWFALDGGSIGDDEP